LTTICISLLRLAGSDASEEEEMRFELKLL
jgi:hypothetical protein